MSVYIVAANLGKFVCVERNNHSHWLRPQAFARDMENEHTDINLRYQSYCFQGIFT